MSFKCNLIKEIALHVSGLYLVLNSSLIVLKRYSMTVDHFKV